VATGTGGADDDEHAGLAQALFARFAFARVCGRNRRCTAEIFCWYTPGAATSASTKSCQEFAGLATSRSNPKRSNYASLRGRTLPESLTSHAVPLSKDDLPRSRHRDAAERRGSGTASSCCPAGRLCRCTACFACLGLQADEDLEILDIIGFKESLRHPAETETGSAMWQGEADMGAPLHRGGWAMRCAHLVSVAGLQFQAHGAAWVVVLYCVLQDVTKTCLYGMRSTCVLGGGAPNPSGRWLGIQRLPVSSPTAFACESASVSLNMQLSLLAGICHLRSCPVAVAGRGAKLWEYSGKLSRIRWKSLPPTFARLLLVCDLCADGVAKPAADALGPRQRNLWWRRCEGEGARGEGRACWGSWIAVRKVSLSHTWLIRLSLYLTALH
jgi:hypothetical protein